jgi:nicotinamide mononucleotide transporter
MILNWLSDNWIEVFGAVTGIIYVILEIKQNIWLWPVGITTSAVYIWVFFSGKLYADMTLQVYYLVISFVGWYWWVRGTGNPERPSGGDISSQKPADNAGIGSNKIRKGEAETVKNPGLGEMSENSINKQKLKITRLRLNTGIILAMFLIIIFAGIWLFLTGLTDSPVPEWDAVITSLSIVATWMLARKIFEHWYLWVIVNSVSMILFIIKGLYPTMILYSVYFIMSFVGLREWKRSL